MWTAFLHIYHFNLWRKNIMKKIITKATLKALQAKLGFSE